MNKRRLETYHHSLLKSYQKLAHVNISLKKSYSDFFERMKDAVFVTDIKGCFIFFNRAAEELTGYSKVEVLGRHFRMLFTLDDLNDGFTFFYQTMKGVYSEHSKFRIRCRSGYTKVVDVLAAPILFDDKVQAAITIAQDASGIPSTNPEEEERVKVFQKFSQDLERWNHENQRVKQDVRKILQKLQENQL